MKTNLKNWLNAWGYGDSSNDLHLPNQNLSADHPYHSEIKELLRQDGEIRAHAVFDIEGVPTVCFFDEQDKSLELDDIRQKVWNQNLISLVLTIDSSKASALPVSKLDISPEIIRFSDAHSFSPYSKADFQSGEIYSRHIEWFRPDKRVDRQLLKNLSAVVQSLENFEFSRLNAQFLMAQVMFISYLEHRQIVGGSYRSKRKVGSLHDLIKEKDKNGIISLLEHLKSDFNGDLLDAPNKKFNIWAQLSNNGLQLLDDFLSRVNLETGQQDLWNYDFRFIPVELISGIYESFLSDEKRTIGAYYTPRHLANLVVNQAFLESKNILKEKIYDGACGSGILLTTAFRRILARAEAERNRQLSFSERIRLLKQSIFGSDINESACRVTAFSLYLSVLENLMPSDIAELYKLGKARLPHLLGSNIKAGEREGDFFSTQNTLASSKEFSIFLCNPPWIEPSQKTKLSSDNWVNQNDYKIPRRQVCAAFMLRALNSLKNDGRLCFILPVSILAAHTSQEFTKLLLKHYQIETVINFGDIRKLLFDDAKQPTLIFVAKPRILNTNIGVKQTMEYWAPKADISLSLGRLALHGTDRHILSASSLARNNSLLTTLFWGTQLDLGTITRLKVSGTLGDFIKNSAGWSIAKGFHKKDSSQPNPISSKKLHKWPYLNARHFANNGPLLDHQALQAFPKAIPTIARLPKSFPEAFENARIVFTDGLDPNREIMAAYSSQPFSFSSSIAAIVAPKEDDDILRFLSVYLHSDLARYFLIMTAYQVIFERERVSLNDIKNFPFYTPNYHSDPKSAEKIIAEVAQFTKILESKDILEQKHLYDSWKPEGEKLIWNYFQIPKGERARVKEVIKYIAPSIQPSTYSDLLTPLQAPASKSLISNYTKTLVSELVEWRNAMNGEGTFQVSFLGDSDQDVGRLGIVKLETTHKKHSSDQWKRQITDNAVIAVLESLKKHGVLPLKIQNNLYLIADTVIRHQDSLYLIKPLIRRLWLRGEAYQDAERIVRFIQGADKN